MPTPDAKWFRARLADKKRTQRDFARVLGIAPSGVCRLLKGERRMQIKEAIAFARLVGVSLEEVLRHAGLLLMLAVAGIATLARVCSDLSTLAIT